MRRRIQDEFTDLPISRQRKYQLRMERDKCCTECGEPAVQGSRCLKHLVKARERQRKKRGLKRRYYGTLSYKLQAVSYVFRATCDGLRSGLIVPRPGQGRLSVDF